MEYRSQPVGRPEGTEHNERRPAHVRELRDYRSAAVKGRGRIDMPFFLLTLILLTFGVIMVLSASYVRAYYSSEGEATRYFVRQLIFAVAGIAVMLTVSCLKVRFFRRISILLLAGSVALLMIVPIIGVEENGATRWINLGFTTFQPSEIAKVALVMSFALIICRMRGRMHTFKYGVLPFAGITVLVVGLLILEPHFSASIIMIAIAIFMMFLGGTRPSYFLAAALVVRTVDGQHCDRNTALFLQTLHQFVRCDRITCIKDFTSIRGNIQI